MTETQTILKAQDLRIGNWLIFDTEHNGKMYLPVTVLREDQICSGFTISYYDNPIIEPIPLTPEILEKAGFVKKGLEIVYQYSIRGINFWFSVLYDPKYNHICFDSPHYGIFYLYLHQLQNLYFALTGNELEINL